MSDKTKKELEKIIADLEDQVEYWKKEDENNRDRIGIKNEKLNSAIKKVDEIKGKCEQEIIKRGIIIGQLMNMIQGMAFSIADINNLPTAAQCPKFLDE